MDKITRTKTKYFHLEQTLDSGQCFRWEKLNSGWFQVIAKDKRVLIEEQKDEIVFHDTNEKRFYDHWIPYFDLSTDYQAIHETLNKDPIMYQAIQEFGGIHLLKQDFFETLISFILSTNNHIPRIKKIIHHLCASVGEEHQTKEGKWHTFPTPKQLSEASHEALSFCKAGYRCAYMKKTAQQILNQEIDWQAIPDMPYPRAKKTLKEFMGVGDKVADCVLLFSCDHYEAFPVDVWIKRIMENLYIKKSVSLDYVSQYGREKFGDLAGYAQQYLFHYARKRHFK